MSGYLPAIIPSLKLKPHVTEDEAKRIWLQAKKTQVRLLIKTLWFTGLRISEAIEITTSSLKEQNLQFSLYVHSKKKHSKNIKPDELPIRQQLGMELNEFIKTHHIGANQRLFPSNRSTYWRRIQSCARRAGLPHWKDIHPHSFRHGFVYHKAKQGVHPYVLSKLSRHEDIRTTLGYYQPTEDDLRQAMEL